jgi:hypothetical protein
MILWTAFLDGFSLDSVSLSGLSTKRTVCGRQHSWLISRRIRLRVRFGTDSLMTPILPSAVTTASASGIITFRGSMAGLGAPLPTLRTCPRGQARTARGSTRFATPSSKRTFTICSLPVPRCLCPDNALRPAGERHHRGRRLSPGAGLFGAAGVFDRRALATRHRRHQCARSSGRHRQGAGMARACEYFHYAHL